MVTQNNNHPSSCPTCEFTHGKPGNPHLCANGTMFCNVCNSKWRELAGNTDSGKIPKKLPGKCLNQSLGSLPLPALSQPSSDTVPQPLASHQSVAWSYSDSPTLLMAGIGAVLFLATLLVYQFYPLPESKPLAKNALTQLTLDNIKTENVKNSNIRVWIISARISNHSAHSLPVPPILMSSGTKGSSGYFDWTVKPALQKLAPGSNLIIRASVRKPAGSGQKVELEFIGGILNSG